MARALAQTSVGVIAAALRQDDDQDVSALRVVLNEPQKRELRISSSSDAWSVNVAARALRSRTSRIYGANFVRHLYGSVTPVFSSCATVSMTVAVGGKTQRSDIPKKLLGTCARCDMLLRWTVIVKRDAQQPVDARDVEVVRCATENNAAACSSMDAVA